MTIGSMELKFVRVDGDFVLFMSEQGGIQFVIPRCNLGIDLPEQITITVWSDSFKNDVHVN